MAEIDNPETTAVEKAKHTDAGLAGVLGDVAYLMMHSPAHRHLFIADMEWLVLPALRLKQMRVFRHGKRPFAYISWAYLTDAAEKRLLAGHTRIAPGEWRTGDRIWIIDSIGGAPSSYPFLKALSNQVFKDREVHLAVPAKGRRGLEGVLLTEVLKEMEKKLEQRTKH